MYVLHNLLSRNEMGGLTSKAFAQVMKLSPIYACSREIQLLMGDDTYEMSFTVTEADVRAAWSLVQFSMHTYKCFKVTVGGYH